jgi:autotransporter-associated beta strand protein
MTNRRQSKITTLISAIAVLAIASLALPRHAAAQVTWTGTSGGDWDTGANWSTGSKPTASGTALFNTTLTSVANAVADQTVGGISFDTNAGTSLGGFTIGTPGGNRLTLGNGGTIQILSTLTGTAKAISVNAPLVLSPANATSAGTYVFANNNTAATNTLNFGGPISGGTTTNTVALYLAGANTGINTVTGNISNGSATTFALGKSGAGTWLLSGSNSFNGGVNAGTDQSGALYINNNNALGTGTFTWSNGFAGNTSGAPVTFANIINNNQNLVTWSTGVGETTGVFNLNHSTSALAVTTGAMFTLRKFDANTSGRGVSLAGGGTLWVKEAAGANVTGNVGMGQFVIVGHQNALGTGTMNWNSVSTFQASTDLTGANAIPNQLTFTSNSGAQGYTFSGTSSIEFSGTATVNNLQANQLIVNNIAAGKMLKFKDFALNAHSNATMTTLFSGSGATEIYGTISNGGGTTRNLTYTGQGATLASLGSLTLSGSNTYTGDTTLSGGTLRLAGSNNSAGGTLLQGGNGTLLPTVLQLDSASNGGLASGTLTLHTGRIEALTASRTLSNNVLLSSQAGNNAVVFQGSQDITITGTVNGNNAANRAIGNTMASGKKLTLGAVNISNGATPQTLTIGGSGDTVITGTVATGGASANGLVIWGGNVTLTQANTYTGATTLSAGTLVLDFSAAGAPTNNIINSGNSLVMSAGGINLKGAGGSATNSQSVVMTNAAGLSQIAVNNNGSTGTTTLALTPTGLGSRTAGATINIDLSQGLGGNANGNAITTIATAATQGWATVKDASGTGFARYSGTNVVRLTGQTTLAGSSNASATDFITAPVGNSTTGSPYLSISAASPSYNSLTIDTGSATGANVLDLNGKTVTLTNKGVLLTGSNDFTIQGTGQLGSGGNEVIVQQMGSGNLTINSAIGSTSAFLTKSGPGTLTLGGTQTYTGPTTVNQGTLVLNANISTASNMAINDGTVRLGDSDRISNGNAMTMKSGGTLDLNGFNETITSLSMDAGATVNGGNSSTLTLSGATPISLAGGSREASVINSNVNFTNSGTVTIDLRQNAYGVGGFLEINGAIGGSAAAIRGGGNATYSTLRLSGSTANTFTGSLQGGAAANMLVELNKTAGVDAIGIGGINISRENSSRQYDTWNFKWLASEQINDSAPIVWDGGFLNLNGFNETVASLTSSGTAYSNPSIYSSAGTLILAGTTGNVLTLNNSRADVSKTLDMNLALSGSGGNISFVSGASTNRTIQIGGSTPGARTLDLGPVVRTIDVANGAMAVDALITSQITGAGGLTKAGAGVLQLTAANTFRGDTTVSSGTLTLGNSLALQNSALDTSGAGAVSITGFNALTLGGLKGSTNLGSFITTGYYGSLYSLTLNPGAGVTNTYSGAITDGSALGLTKTGAGTQVLTGVNTYSGATTINGGRLQVDSTGSIGSTSAVVINGVGADLRWNSATAFNRPLTFTQGTISGSGSIGVPVTVAANTFISPGNSPGIQTYTSGLTWASGGSYLWEINDWTGAAGTAFDQVAVSGSPLNIAATSGSPFTINITSLTGSNTAGAVGNWSETSKTFTIATAGSLTNFSADKFTLNTSAFSPTFTGSWSITGTGNALQLNYTALPSTTTGSYSLAASAVSSTIIVGGTSNISSVITNTGTGTADTLNYGPLTVTYAGGTTSLTGSGLALAQGASGTATGGFTNNTAGTYTLTPAGTVTNATLGGAATLGTVTSSTVTVLNHSNAALSLASGGGQTIITGGTFNAVTFNLTNAGTNNAAVQVNGLVNLSGSTGSAVVASGGSVSYTGTGLDNTLIGVNNLLVSATAGDQQSLSGASALTTISATTSYTVLDHATSSLLGSSVSTSTTLNLGEWDYLTQTWTSGTGSAGFSVFNLASVNGDALTALLALTSSTSSGDAGFSTNLNTYSQIAGGGSQGFSVSFDPTGISTSGTYSRIFTINMADQQNLSGAAATNTLTVAANVIVVPEPGAIALAGIGIAAAAYAYRRRR